MQSLKLVRSVGRWICASAIIFICTAPAHAGVDGGEKVLVENGDKVSMHFSCYMPNGELLATTEKAVYENDNIKKIDLYLPQDDFSPWVVLANSGYGGEEFDHLPTLNSAIAGKLSKKITGLGVNERKKFRISGGNVLADNDPGRFLTMARRAQFQNFTYVTVDKFKELTGEDPKKGMKFGFNERSVSSTVDKIEQNVVVVRDEYESGSVFITMMGKTKLIKQEDGSYMQEFLLNKGDYILSGNFMGLITDVDEHAFTVDYGDPFAGRDLACDVQVVDILSKLKRAQ